MKWMRIKSLFALLFMSGALLGQVKISELTTASGYGDDDDHLIINENNATRKITKGSLFHHSTVYHNTISEYSAGNGVYIDGFFIKDGNGYVGLGNYMYFDDDLDSYWYGNADDDMQLVSGSQIILSATPTLFTLYRTTVPQANNTYDLGSSTDYWARCYSKLLYTDAIAEVTADNGVSIDGVLIKDNNIHIGLNDFVYLDDDNDSYLYALADDQVQLVAGGSTIFEVVSGELEFYKGPRGTITDNYDLGTSSLYWKDFYAQKWYIDDASTTIENSGGDMTLTDANAGAATLHELKDNTITENAQTGTTYTLVLADAGKRITLANASDVTVTVPPNSSVAFPTGTRIVLERWGAGEVTVAEGSGVTVNSLDGKDGLDGLYATATLIKDATDTWILSGDLVSTPVSNFTGTLFKMVTFSEVAPGALTQANWQTMLGSSDISHTVETAGTGTDAYDSTKIWSNVNGSPDTVRVVMMGDDQGSTGDGVLIRGDMHLNGSNNTHDTLTDVCFKMSVLFPNWPYEYSNGGKIGGFGGSGTDDEDPPDGGQYDCTCSEPDTDELCDDDGFSTKLGYREGGADEDIIAYTYSHELMASTNCVTKTYGQSITDGDDDIATDTWYEFTIRCRLNTGYAYDGIIEIFRNDTCVYSDAAYKWKSSNGIYIDYWMIEQFAGGTPDNDWAGDTIVTDDYLLFQTGKWDAYGLGTVMTNVPDFHTDNND